MSGDEKDKVPKTLVETDEGLSEADLASLDEAPAHHLRALIKRSLTSTETDDVAPTSSSGPAPEAALLVSVQKKLRKRSRGKFYGDGWSTAQTRFNYALIALVMLVTLLAVYLALGPTGFSLR